MTLTAYRKSVTAILSDALSDDVSLIDHIPDSIAPPAIVFGWSNPWLVASTWCEFTSVAELIVVSQRIEPGGHLEILESMVESIIEILVANRISIRDVTAPYPIVLGGVNYLACSINIVTELGE